jgi:hypothetical protein
VSDSFWKKEISFGRKPKKNEEPIEGVVAPAVKAILEPEQPRVAPTQVAAPADAPADAPAADTAPPVSGAAESPADLPARKGDYGWLTTSFDPNDLPDEMPAIAAPPVSGPPPVRVPLAESLSARPVDLEPVAVPISVESAVEPEPEGASEAPATPFWK